MVYHPALASAVQTKSPSGSHQWSSDFAFLIPEITDRLTAGSPEICELLPPSFISGPLFPRLSGRPNPRSDVIYSLHVTVEYMHRIGTEGLSGSWKRLEHEQQFDFLPYIEVQSPTNIGSFPLEFITHINIPVWRSFLGGYLGSIELATSEPEPLKYASVSSPASTYCVLTFSIGASPRIYRRLRKLEIKIQPLVRAKTYYTTEEIHCPPRQTSLTHQGLLRLQDSVMRLPPESFSAITWRYLPVGQSETAGELPPLYSESAMPLPLPPPSMTGSGEAGIFRASIILAVQPVEALLPTFCSHLMARSYTLLMKLLMNGLYCKAVDLEVPLQVAYPRPTAQADDPSPNSSLERRDSRCRGVKRLLGEDKVQSSFLTLFPF